MSNKNNVVLLDYMGSDKSHSVAAWASTFYDLDLKMPKNVKIRIDQIVDYILSKSKKIRSIEQLLSYLAQNEHESPFRMSSFMFGMTTDVATHIQKLKHSVILEAQNAESAKYKELKEDKFYLPIDWEHFYIENKNLLSKYNVHTYSQLLYQKSNELNEIYHACLQDGITYLGNKRAKETARYFKMYNSQINSINKFSFAGIMTFYNKRTVDFAQEEIKNIAKEMVYSIKNIDGNPFEYSLNAFGLIH
jgi:thymidylate synthase ThyX